MAWKTFMVKRTITIALVVTIVFSFGYLASDFQCSAQQRLQTVAAFMSGTWDRKADGSVSVLIPDYPDDQYYILFGAYVDPKEEVTKVLGKRIARKIKGHGDEKGYVLYVVRRNRSVYSADVYVPSFGKGSILSSRLVVIVKNSSDQPSGYKRLTLINGMAP